MNPTANTSIRAIRDKIFDTLAARFSANKFKYKQEQAIVASVLGYDTFVQMPTGYLFLNISISCHFSF